MVIGVVKCTEENLVALVPQVTSKLIKDEYQIIVESDAGVASGYSNELYESAGAVIASRKEVLSKADIILTGTAIEKTDLKQITKNSLLVGKFNGRVESNMLTDLREATAQVFSLDLLPRSTIAQSMDVLSSLASLSGYKAVVTAADEFAGYFPMMTTSAGTIPPARVLVLGAGVAGLQAIATAKRLGAIVEAFDVRTAVREEVQSLGAKFIEVEGSQEDTTAGGYAVEQSETYIKKQKELIHETAVKADIVISTANIPGRKAPVLIENRTVAAMKKGSVIVDMASASGGNCELSKDSQTIDVDGVTIIGDSKLYNLMGKQASLLYSNNIYNFLKYILKDGKDNLSYDSEIISKTLLREEEKSAVSA
ncbi:MAG: NAD(P) transhydrogenase subunit alpha [Reichenbachiella sp.]|uniref:NAD(P) transhydrogenase subunit alpha n=1 Tax=Reichenbachiella sp. TaxID=2184521 RepID=UPI0032638FB9